MDENWSQKVKRVGGFLVVTAGIVAVIAIAATAIIVARSSSSAVASIATGSFTMIGTVVGAYFGVKVGKDSGQEATDRVVEQAKATADQVAEHAKATAILAASLHPDEADDALKKAGLL